jgi:hypothetical protein
MTTTIVMIMIMMVTGTVGTDPARRSRDGKERM